MIPLEKQNKFNKLEFLCRHGYETDHIIFPHIHYSL